MDPLSFDQASNLSNGHWPNTHLFVLQASIYQIFICWVFINNLLSLCQALILKVYSPLAFISTVPLTKHLLRMHPLSKYLFSKHPLTKYRLTTPCKKVKTCHVDCVLCILTFYDLMCSVENFGELCTHPLSMFSMHPLTKYRLTTPCKKVKTCHVDCVFCIHTFFDLVCSVVNLGSFAGIHCPCLASTHCPSIDWLHPARR